MIFVLLAAGREDNPVAGDDDRAARYFVRRTSKLGVGPIRDLNVDLADLTRLQTG
jgi:hypothetical protein